MHLKQKHTALWTVMAAKFIYICGVIARGVMDLRQKAKNDFGVYEKQAFWVSPRLHYHQVLVKATSCGFKSLHPHQTKIIRTCFRQEMGSDYCFSLTVTKAPISATE